MVAFTDTSRQWGRDAKGWTRWGVPQPCPAIRGRALRRLAQRHGYHIKVRVQPWCGLWMEITKLPHAPALGYESYCFSATEEYSTLERLLQYFHRLETRRHDRNLR